MKLSLLPLILLLMPSLAFALYYADVEILVSDEGAVIIDGLTNHQGIMPGEYFDYSSVKAGVFTLNLTLNDSFDYFVYKLVLPQGAVINYLSTPSRVRITEESGRIVVSSSGVNESLFAVVQYSLRGGALNHNFLWLLLLIPSSLVIFFFSKRTPKKRINYSLLTEREASIIKVLVARKQVTQALLAELLKLPKASLSRNINSLIRKGLIIKAKKGFTNVITLK